MDIKKLLVLPILPLLLLAGCSNDDWDNTHEQVAVHFETGDIAGLPTRTTAGGSQWEQDDRIGIFMVKNAQPLNAASIAENADNVQYKADENTTSSGFSPVTSTLYYPSDGSNVDFIAYYPYKATGTNTGEINNYLYPVDVSRQTHPAGIDILYSNAATGYNKTSSTVTLPFSHALSKLNFTLLSGIGPPDLSGATIEISNLYRTADLALTDGSLSNHGSQGTITANSENYAIVIPQTANNSKLTITLAGNTYEWNFPPTTHFQAGLQYSYTITVNKTDIEVSTGNITGWTGTGDTSINGGAGPWKVGDYYPDPSNSATAIGIVFWIDPSDNRHGKIVGLREITNTEWATTKVWIRAMDTANGRANMGTILRVEGNYSQYPLFAAVHALNPGNEDYFFPDATGIWYLPAIDELLILKNVGEAVESGLTSAGGIGFLMSAIYWSSTEINNDRVNTLILSGPSDLFHSTDKQRTGWRARYISAF